MAEGSETGLRGHEILGRNSRLWTEPMAENSNYDSLFWSDTGIRFLEIFLVIIYDICFSINFLRQHYWMLPPSCFIHCSNGVLLRWNFDHIGIVMSPPTTCWSCLLWNASIDYGTHDTLVLCLFSFTLPMDNSTISILRCPAFGTWNHLEEGTYNIMQSD